MLIYIKKVYLELYPHQSASSVFYFFSTVGYWVYLLRVASLARMDRNYPDLQPAQVQPRGDSKNVRL